MTSTVDAWTALRTGLSSALDAGTLAQWQLGKLREAIAYARGHSPFQEERLRAFAPRSLVSLEDLDRLPFTWPADLARDPLAFLCVPQSQVARVTTLTTSGSTGPRKRVFFSEHDLERTVDFFAHGMTALVDAGQDTLILMSGETEHSIGRLLQTALARVGVKACIGDPGWRADEAIAAARAAACLVGIPAQILCLCRMDRSLRPRSVLLSADFVPRSVVRGIEEAWHCRVFTHYGLTETGFGCAVQCASRQGHHVRAADLLLEVVDPITGARLPLGELGEIVVTTLRNEAMPLLRYRTGDLARLVREPCGCGSTLPRLGRVEGRRESEIPLGHGGTLSIHRLDERLFSLPALRGFEAELRWEGGRDTLFLDINADGRLDQGLLRSLLPEGLALQVRYTDATPFPLRGKRRIQGLGCGD